MIETILKTVAQYLETGNILVYVFVYLAGVLTSLSPCVYPVIPLTIAYFSSQQKDSKKETFLLALLYVIGMSLVYALLGMIATLTGSLFGKIAVSPFTLFIFANICILLGLSMMEVFEIPLPKFLTSGKGVKQKKGYLGSFLLGGSAGLIVGPCTTPVLAVLLTYVGGKQNVVFGMSLLFVFAFGMGTLLLFLGTFSGLIHNLPKSGKWMVILKKIAGLIMIGLGEYFLIQAGKMLF